MSKLFKFFAMAAVTLGFALVALAASAGINLVQNWDFGQLTGGNTNQPVGWTLKNYKPSRADPQPTYGSSMWVTPAADSLKALGIANFLEIYCDGCPLGRTATVAQQINGLVENRQYQLTFQVYGSSYDTSGFWYTPQPFRATLGTLDSGPLPVPIGHNENSESFTKETWNFTYTDPNHSSSALLTLIQTFSKLVSCGPCADRSLLTNISLRDVTPAAPVLSVQKALNGNRGANSDQFTVQILDGIKVVNSTTNSTTTGSNAVVDTGTGTTGPTTLTEGTSYKITEVGSGNTNLGGYGSTLACTNATGTKVPTALNTAFTLSNTDTVSCTITNKVKPATLAVRQMVADPLPVNIVAPFTFSYSGTNGWPAQLPVKNPVKNGYVTSAAQTLSAFSTDTTVGTTLPDDRWNVKSVFGCVDTTSAASGNPSTNLATGVGTSVTIPAVYVRPGANLRCTIVLGHTVP